MFFSLVNLLSAPALAQGAAPPPAKVVIWVDTAPDEKTAKKAEAKMDGAAKVYTPADLAFPPEPWGPEDEKAYKELDKSMQRSRERWEEFDVELSIAQEVSGAIAPITVVRGEEDRLKMVDANLMLGAAVTMAFTPEDFKNSGDAQAFRLEVPGLVANKAFVDVLALDEQRKFTRAEVANAQGFDELEKLRQDRAKMAKGTVTFGALPSGATLYVNGRAMSEVGESIDLAPGHYYFHLEQGGMITGRAEVDVYPGTPVELPRLVDDRELAAADRRVSVGASDGLPEDVVKAVEYITKVNPGAQVYLAALDADGNVVVVPYSANATLKERQVVTFAIGAEFGGAATASAAYWYGANCNPDCPDVASPDNRLGPAPNQRYFAPAATGALDLELGIYNLALLGGGEVYITPTQRMVYGTLAEADGGSVEDNKTTNVYFRGHGGLGVYILRPTRQKTATMLVGGTYGYYSPGHMGPGGRVTVGIPMAGHNWFRLTLYGFYGNSTLEGYPEKDLFAGGLRIGFQTAF